MKRFIIVIILLTLTACKTQKNFATTTPVIESDCPTAGTCNFEVLKDKGLNVVKDNTGRTYYTIIDAPGKVVIKYAYNKTRNPALPDDFYNEVVAIETDAAFTNLTNGNHPEEVYVTVQCFCRGKAGTYVVIAAKVEYNNNKLHIKLPENIFDGQLTKDIWVSFK
ncbi:hypothetical protein FMM05_05185 [Flavobacterium zepuense]|uniref:Lipoprotein n=1 Tax=Flavobacterium zepuense TaxID=2593302 RepID=A0A552V8H6_9FLAO|nr:hypothetical protein [Flavobacterium zepuense]TRW26772.1 hypothetical protein FMM05_05185 [Flavobacterium zepuense]